MRSIELKGLFLSGTVAVTLGSLVAALVYITPLRETLLDPLANLILILSVFVGGSYVAKTRGTRGLTAGVTVGLLFFVIMFILSLIFCSSPLNFKPFLKDLATCIIAGGLGGILGIGLSN